MEDIPNNNDHVENMDVDDAASEEMEKCFTNKIVVNKILQHFPDRQLLDQLSLVNKMWNYEARNVMRKRGNLYAWFGTEEKCLCKEFKRFLLDLQQMNVVPFDGIRIELNYQDQKRSCPKIWKSKFEAILKRLTLNNFSVSLEGNWRDQDNCLVLIFIKQVFHHFSPVLEKLYLEIHGGEEAFIPKLIAHASFPRLKILKLDDVLSEEYSSHTNLVKTIISRAPNLQEFHCRGDINYVLKLLEATSAVFVLATLVEDPLEAISDNVNIGALRLKTMQLEYTGREFDFERFKRFAPILLQVCCTTTLRSMKIDAVLPVPLMTYGVCLQNVKYLDMFINYDQLELTQPIILRIIKEFDFTRIFPSLDSVIVKSSPVGLEPGHMNRLIEEANAVLREPLPDRAVNIKKLSLNVGLSHANAQFFTQMFPKLRNLWIEGNSEALPLGYIWEHWRDLETLGLRGTIMGNADCLFCGIFPEEVAELHLMDDEYLERVNIVPVMPAITCLRNLKDLTLGLRITPRQHSTSLSKVIRLIAFKGLSLH